MTRARRAAQLLVVWAALHLPWGTAIRRMDPPSSFLGRGPKPAVTCPVGVAVKVVDEGVTIGADRHEIHEAFRAQVLVCPMVEMLPWNAGRVADKAILRQFGSPVSRAYGTPFRRLDVCAVLGGAVLCAARCGHINDGALCRRH